MVEFTPTLIALGKLTLAAMAGAAIGFEREAHGQAAGLRTNILVCVGACLMMQLSLYMEELFRHLPQDLSVVRLDPGRIASYAIASMGFLGAGAIITGKGTVRGLTTAAGLWLVTGIGLAIGAGFFYPSLFAVLLSLLCLYALRQAKGWFHRDTFTVLTLKFQGQRNHLEEVMDLLRQQGIQINFISYKREAQGDLYSYRLHLEGKDTVPMGQVFDRIKDFPQLLEVEWAEGKVL